MARRGRKRKGYFYEEQEQAVIDYLTEKDLAKREKVFNELLYPAFTKMIDCIIRRYKFFYTNEDYEQTWTDTYSYLITKLEKFDPTKGHKAYSYFGTVCKHYLIMKAEKYEKAREKQESYEDKYKVLCDTGKYSDDGSEQSHEEFLMRLTGETVVKIQEIIENEADTLSDDEIKVGLALINLFKNWNEIFIEELGSKKFNKSKILLYLKELTMLKTPEIRNNLKRYKAVYYDLKKAMLDE